MDTNIVLYFLGGDETLSSILEENQLYISVITEMELLSFPQLTEKEIEKIQDFLYYCTVLDLSDKVKEKAIKVRKEHKLKLPDAIIFGTAMSLDTVFITADTDFSSLDSDLVIIYKN